METAVNGLALLGNICKWLENGKKWMHMAVNDWKWLEIAGNF